MPLDARRIIASRACDELVDGAVVNLGIGMPEGIASIAAERGLLDRCTLTVESGPIGGRPAGGLSFGASSHPQAIVDQPAQFDFYDGGGLDFAALGAAEIDAAGNVNVSRFHGRFVGVGGFVNIAQNARRLVFCGTFTAGGLEVAVGDGRLKIVCEGRTEKFVAAVEQVSFSAATALAQGQRVLYVTERAVLALTAAGLEVIEVAPGIDLEADVISRMGFRPVVRDVRPMPAHCFRPPASRMGKEGLEPSSSFPGNTAIFDPGGAKSGALPANLKHVVDNWGSLTEDDRRRIRAIVDGRLS
jgi:propionate CoA-transferase